MSLKCKARHFAQLLAAVVLIGASPADAQTPALASQVRAQEQGIALAISNNTTYNLSTLGSTDSEDNVNGPGFPTFMLPYQHSGTGIFLRGGPASEGLVEQVYYLEPPDGRSLVGALAMGADGINMGTRFIATKEAPVHDNVKQAIVVASELDTRLVMRPLRNTERVLNNPAVERLLEKERTLGADLKFEDIIDEVAGVYPKVMIEGKHDEGAWSCGMVAGLIHDVPSVQELIDRIMSEADSIIHTRLSGLYL